MAANQDGDVCASIRDKNILPVSGQQTVCCSSGSPLVQDVKNRKPQEARWIQHLQQYDLKIEHRPRHLHGNVNGLSRRPWPENPTSDTFGEAQNFCEPLVVGATTSDGSTAFVEDGNESEPTLGQSSQRISI